MGRPNFYYIWCREFVESLDPLKCRTYPTLYKQRLLKAFDEAFREGYVQGQQDAKGDHNAVRP